MGISLSPDPNPFHLHERLAFVEIPESSFGDVAGPQLVFALTSEFEVFGNAGYCFRRGPFWRSVEGRCIDCVQ